MADRGVDDENPFSFKTFVSVKDKKVPRQSSSKEKISVVDDVDDIFGVNDTKLSHPKKEQAAPGPTKATVKKDKPKDNPFSFKKFLSSGSSSGKLPSDPALTTSQHSSFDATLNRHVPENHTSDIFASSGEEDNSVPVDAIDCDLLANSVNLNLASGVRANHDDNRSDDEMDAPSAFPGNDSASNIPLALPDFLSDAAGLGKRKTSLQTSDESLSNREDLLGQIRVLQEENNRLRAELNREKQKCSDKNQKLSQLKIDLERQKKKEAEETAVMERAVQQVEENLVTTTKRAVQAEATVTKLKQEVKTLQNQVKTLNVENESYRSGDGGLSDIRERTKYSSEQLASAAVIAEKNLKELMTGVDKLKLLSQVLSSLEKVTEVKTDTPQDDDTKPS